MTRLLGWYLWTERGIGRGHATLVDTINRALRSLLTLSGFDPDGEFTGFQPVFNVHAYGAVRDPSVDSAPAFQAAVNAATAAGGGIVRALAGSYYVGATVLLSSNVIIEGAGRGRTTIRDHVNLGNNRIFFAQGTSGAHLSNIIIRNLTIRNGSAATNDTNGRDGLRTEYVDYLTLEEVEITEIQGTYGLVIKWTTNVNVRKCRFYRCSYSMFTVLVECDTIRVEDTEFDTNTNTVQSNCYTFATGGETLAEGAFFCRNVWITRCTFKNNPRWEGLDFHGGENIWVTDCRIENALHGINAALTGGFVSSPVLKNVRFRNMKIIQGTGAGSNGYGIIVQGLGDRTVLAEDVIIEGCNIEGFGGVTSNTIGAITVNAIRKVTIRHNVISGYFFSAIVLVDWIIDCLIADNDLVDCANIAFDDSGAIALRSTGAWGVRVEANVCRATSLATTVHHFIKNAFDTSSVQFGHGSRANRILQANDRTSVSGSGALPWERSVIPTTSLRMQYGDVVLTNTGKPGWYCSAPTLGYGSLDTTTVLVTGTISLATPTIVTLVSSARDYRALPPGMNISIAGAGPAAAALNCRVLKNNVTSIEIDTAASTAVTGANVTNQSLTLVTA